MTKKKNIRQVIRGDYVATPLKNAFNDKTSYWFSKKGYTVSLYMFTVEGQGETVEEFEQRLSEEGFVQMINYFEDYVARK